MLPSSCLSCVSEAKAVLINKSDIDLTTLTQSGATVTSMLLTSGKTGFC
jgi:hypothetical protein